MLKLRLALIASALVLGSTGLALAGNGSGGDAKREQRHAKRLAKFDTNKDGKLDAAERQVAHDERMTKRFAMLDVNKDGAISLAEMKAAKPFGKHHGGKRGGKQFRKAQP